jgi:lysozyme family protein
MANFDLFFPKLIKHEGGFVDHPSDPGGATNYGITIGTFRQYGWDKDGDGFITVDDLRLISLDDAYFIYQNFFWDKVLGNYIKNQQLAELIADFYINAPYVSIRVLQKVLNDSFKKQLSIDGILGKQTLEALNSVPQKALFDEFKAARIDYYKYRAGESSVLVEFFKSIGAGSDSKYAVFLKGWLKRANSFVFNSDFVKKKF